MSLHKVCCEPGCVACAGVHMHRKRGGGGGEVDQGFGFLL